MKRLLWVGVALLAVGCAPFWRGDGAEGGSAVPMPKRPATQVTPSPTDSDHDGVPNDSDRCPDTANGTPVDTAGCALIEKVVLHGVYFDSGSADVKPAAHDLLRSVAVAMLVYPELQVEIRGYSDSVGAAEANRALSERRAQAVGAFLVKEGVAGTRLSIRGLGEADPVDTNDTPEGRSRNRRVGFKVITD